MSESSSRFLHFAIVFACLCVAIVLRFGNFGHFFTNITGHYNFIDTDCYYQLRRILYFLANFPRTLSFDPTADWPVGSRVDWPDGLVYIVGLPLKLFGVNSFKGLELGACLVMVAIGTLTCFLNYRLALRVLKNVSLALFVLFITSTNFLLIRFSCLGEIDHHILEALFPPLVLLLSLKTFLDGSRAASILLGVCLGFWVFVSSSSVFMIACFFVLYAFVFGRKETQSTYLRVVLCLFLVLIPIVILNYSSLNLFVLLTHPSMFHLSLFAVFAILGWTMVRYEKKALISLALVFVLSVLGYFANMPRVIMEPLREALLYVFGSGGVLQNVSEANSIFMLYGKFQTHFMNLNFGYLIYLLPLVWVLVFFLKKFKTEEKAMLLSLALLAIPGVFQKRFSQIMVCLFLVFIVWCLSKILLALKEKELRIGPMVTLLFLGFSVFPAVEYGFYPTGSGRDRVDLGLMSFFTEKIELKPEQVWNRLALKEPVTEAVWANPNLGHMVQYMTGLGVFSNSFYHWQSFELDYDLRKKRTLTEFQNFLRDNKVRYLLIVDDFQFFELHHSLRQHPADYFVTHPIENGQRATRFQMEELLKFAWVRLLLDEEESAYFSRLFRARFNEDHFYNFVNAYEFKDL